MMKNSIIAAALIVFLSLALVAPQVAFAGKDDSGKWTLAVKPKPLSENVNRGLQWLAAHQDKDGGWGQGEESENMGHGMDNLRGVSNVADTCIATLALIRAGSTPAKGPYAKNIKGGIDFICGEVEKAEPQGLFVTSVKGTRVQSKLGPYIDTFMASLVLAEVKGQMPDAQSEKRVSAALNKTLEKIAKNQKDDGTWDNQGWAPTLSQAMAGKALNRASQAGAPVNEKVRQKTETYARKQYDQKSGGFSKDGSAGVSLYSSASSLGNMQDSANTNTIKMKETEQQLAKAKTQDERDRLQGDMKRYRENEKDLDSARQAVVKKLEDPSFVQGFGSNGGEEFLSYMNIGESLVVKGGPEWQKWDQSMTANMNRIQNKDGSWTGHHCITGRTFCTGAALLVLTVDRAPVPVAAKMKKQ
jgi:hypothetical protein